MKNTSIEWADHTFNPWVGCEPVSEGCRNCYAAALNNRFKNGTAEMRGGRAVFNGTVKRTSASYWKQPLAWNERPFACDFCDKSFKIEQAHQCVKPGEIRAAGELRWHRPRVFCASMADWLHEAVPVEWLADLLDLIRRTPNLDWLLLTKRPEAWLERMREVGFWCAKACSIEQETFVTKWYRYDQFPSNVWIGTSVEDQAAADARIPALLKIPAAVRFLSCEPLLGAVDLRVPCNFIGGIDWVIAGGESGARARPMHPDWVRGLRDQCRAAGVPFLFKQWGEWAPHVLKVAGDLGGDLRRGTVCHVCADRENDGHFRKGDRHMERVGKKAAGRLLDGREWNEFPTDKVANVVAGKSGQEDLDLRASAPLREASEIPEVGNG